MIKGSLSPPLWALLCAALLLTVPETAQAKRLVVIGPAAAGRGAKSVARLAQRKLVQQAKALGWQVRRIEGRRAKKALRCIRRGNCARRLARTLRADALLSSSVWRRGRRVRVALRLLDERGRRIAADSLRSRRPRGVASQAARIAAKMLGRAMLDRPAPQAAPAAESSAPTLTAMASADPVMQQVDSEVPPP